ncbi:hypothetical protein JCM12298_16210 [Desulfothermus naphthae]
MKKKFNLLCVFLFILMLQNSYSLTISPVTDASQLVNNIIDPSSISVSNISFTGSLNAVGIFSDGLSSGLGIDNGIILTSGSAAGAVGPNNNSGYSIANQYPGDKDLTSLVAPSSTFDATVLQFDFNTLTNNLYFNFVFASEEYEEYVNSGYNDVFAFFIDGTNIALVPNTNDPVSINTINQSINSSYYISNVNGAYNIQYDGFTTVLTAQLQGLSTGNHHMKIAIADTGDYVYDSAVFIEAGTFSGNNVNSVPEPASLTLIGLGFSGFFISRRKKS